MSDNSSGPDSAESQPTESQPTEPLVINGVRIEATFAEAFDMKATRVIITAMDEIWAEHAASAMSGFGTSVIDCKLEIDVERRLFPHETPDGRPGISLLAFAMSGSELEKQILRRAGQCVLTCPTTALFAGLPDDGVPRDKQMPLGKSLRYFGDGNQISKVIDGKRFWRIPVMDGEFICQHEAPRGNGIGGGNFLLVARDIMAASRAARAATGAIESMADVITPFPGGVTRSGSKIGSKYKTLIASTNDAYCPTLRGIANSQLGEEENAVLEIVLDGLTFESIADAMRTGITAACQSCGEHGLVAVSAGNYGGKLGRHHFHLHEILS